MKREVFLLGISIIFYVAHAAECEYYKVQKGDTLSDIAEKKGLSVEDILSVNRGLEKGKLITGKRICIPQKNSAQLKGKKEETVKHKVRKGETLSSIAKKYNVSVDDIAKANKLKKREIMVGETLFIPTKGKHEIGVSKREDKPIKVVEEKNEEKNAVNREEVNIGRHSIQMPVDGKIVKAARGVDIITKCESTIKSVEDGKVVYSGGDLQAYGNMVIIEHDDFISLYAYNSKNLVKRGDSVSKGQDIAMVGNKNGSDECVLHFEIRAKDGAPLDPTEYLKNTQ
ncbi:MAG: LysM peptidoglycan-binding domain-containing protein [Aquificaceae bacterium]